MDKQERYLSISKEIVELIGGQDNIQGSAHCATRLRVVLVDVSLVQLEKLEDVDLVKGVFITGNQLQLIFGAGLVNEVYEVFSELTHTQGMTLGEVKQQGSKNKNPIQTVIKSLSDVFIEIMPGILAAALLMGVTGVLGKWDVVTNNETLYALNRLAGLASTGIFAILPMAVCYSATKRYGGKPILGMIVGAIMLDASLANAYSIGTEGFNPEVLHLFGLNIQMIGFQGGIIIALMMGFVTAKLDIFFDKKIPNVVKLLFSPLFTVFISTVLLFAIVGPIGRELSNGITGGLIWLTENLGAVGYMIFAGLQQIIVITGLHHILGAVEAQLIADTGRNFINPLMSVALIGQGGAVLGYLALNWKNIKTRELCIPSFASILFGISEPAIFGVNLRYKFPLIGGCIGASVAGAYVYFASLAALGFGTTAVPGIAIVDPTHNGYVHYIIAHLIGLVIGFICTIILGKMSQKTTKVEKLLPIMEGEIYSIEKCHDAMFATKTLGDGIVIEPTNGKVVAPCEGTIAFVFPAKHALGIRLDNGISFLIHCGINTVELAGEGFMAHVKEGDRIKAGDLLLEMDLDFIKEKGFDIQTMLVLSENNENKTVSFETKQGGIATIQE